MCHLCGARVGRRLPHKCCNDICVATGIAVRCLRDTRCRQCTGKRLSRTIWSSFNKERMSHLCDSTVASPTARRDNVLASKCEYPLFRSPPVKKCPNLGEDKTFKNLLMPLFLMGCFLVDFQEVKRPLRTKSGKRPIKVGKRPIKEGKRPIKAMVLVGISVGCLMGCFRAPPPWRKTAPLKRPIKRSMKHELLSPSLREAL